jgi:hypothetical protein
MEPPKNAPLEKFSGSRRKKGALPACRFLSMTRLAKSCNFLHAGARAIAPH